MNTAFLWTVSHIVQQGFPRIYSKKTHEAGIIIIKAKVGFSVITFENDIHMFAYLFSHSYLSYPSINKNAESVHFSKYMNTVYLISKLNNWI